MGSGRGILELATLGSQQFRSEDRPLQGPRTPSGAPLNPKPARRRTKIPLTRPSFVMLCTTRSIIGSFLYIAWPTMGHLATSLSVVTRKVNVNWCEYGIFRRVYVQCTYTSLGTLGSLVEECPVATPGITAKLWIYGMIIPLLAMNYVAVFPGESASPADSGSADAGFFGLVAMDPWYTYNTDQVNFPNDVNRAFLERMAADIANMGATWIRIELHAEYNQPSGPGPIDFAKYDWFINEIAPKYGLKVLVVAGSGTIGDLDPAWNFQYINEPLGAGGSNRYIDVYLERIREVTERYGNRIGAIEILNEPNASEILSMATSGRQKSVLPANYGHLIRSSYEIIKEINPSVQVVLGGMLYDTENNTVQPGKKYTYDMDWLEAVYGSRQLMSYWADNGHYPFDAIAVHPYFLDPTQVMEYLSAVRELQLRFNDSGSKVWITEIGMPAEPPESWDVFGLMMPSDSEREQAAFMSAVYNTVQQRAGYVERIFWFKYEDFPDAGGAYESYGLVRLHDTLTGYGSNPEPWPRKFAYSVYQALAQPTRLPLARVPKTDDPGVWYFDETGHTLSEPFLSFWLNHGGHQLLGYPLTEPFQLAGRQVQYFERARLELHPEFAGTDREIQFGLLGSFIARDQTWEPQPAPTGNDPNRTYFHQTGQYLGGPFRDFWHAHGGMLQFGSPISPEITEGGKTVQYFERARMELNLVSGGESFWVGLGRLGAEALKTPGWYR